MKISVEKIKLFAHHGWYAEEQQTGNWFEVTVEISLPTPTEINDDLQNTFNYEWLYQLVVLQMEATQKLLETVCNNILSEIKKQKVIETATVKICKLSPAKMDKAKKVCVEMSC